MRRLALVLLLAGCGGDEAGEQATGTGNAQASATPPASSPPPPTDQQLAASRGAAAALTRYYDHIGRGDYRAAFAMREPAPGLTRETFAAGFARYGDYRATVGVPSLPVEQDGTLWVSVPVQLYGRMRDGAPMGSVGRVMMKQPRGSREWQVAP